jgi:serine protease Do
MPTTRHSSVALLVLIAAVLVLGAVLVARPPDAAAIEAAAQRTTPAAPPGVMLPNFASLVATYGPTVVAVEVEGTARGRTADARPGEPADPLDGYFGPPRATPFVRGEGSGFVIAADGVILTNAHVVKDADEVTVKLVDRREFRAKVIGTDARTDVAVLKIDAHGLPVARLASASAVNVGDWVVAIGAPFGLENTVTAGIVSAKGRSLPDDGYVPFLQTDVAVNPGNSGGPLFDLAGDVVGINSQIYSRTGGWQGVSFAIPIDVALDVSRQLLSTGRVERARLGATVQEVTQDLARSFGLERPRGALVADVEPDSAAAAAGLRAGDVILAIDGRTIADSGELPSTVGRLRPGTRVRLSVWRDGKDRDVVVRLGAAVDDRTLQTTDATDARNGRLGLIVRPLTAEERELAGVPVGLLVEEASGPGARAGLEAGDIILSANGKDVGTVAALRDATSSAASPVTVLVQRGRDRLFIPIRIG